MTGGLSLRGVLVQRKPEVGPPKLVHDLRHKMELLTKHVKGQSYRQLAMATAGRTRLDAPYFSRFMVQTLGPTILIYPFEWHFATSESSWPGLLLWIPLLAIDCWHILSLVFS